MASLRDPVPPDEARLIDVVLRTYVQTGKWPIYQYVQQRLVAEKVDLRRLLTEMPYWQHNYRTCVRDNAGGSDLGDRMRLTVYGLARAERTDLADSLIGPFLAALRIGAEVQTQFTPDPDQIVELSLTGETLAIEVEKRYRYPTNSVMLGSFLSGETTTWAGVTFNRTTADSGWTWDLTSQSLVEYAEINHVEDYLDHVEALVLPRPGFATTAPVPPLTLPMMIDYVDSVWRLHTKEHLFQTNGLLPGAKLAQPCVTYEDFESRCSAFADILSNIRVPIARAENEGVLLWLARYLDDKLDPTSAEHARSAIDKLRLIVKLRAGQQHSGVRRGNTTAIQELGLSYSAGNWTEMWDAVTARAVSSLEQLREVIHQLSE